MSTNLSQASTVFDYIIYIGRFQILHNGHIATIKRALSLAKKVVVVIGSSNMPRTIKNPFTAEEVKNNITEFYSQECESGMIKVMIIPDICSIEFGRGVGYDIIERIPPQEIGDISATKIREEMKQNGQL